MSHGGGSKHAATDEEIRAWAARPSYEELEASVARLRAVVEKALNLVPSIAARAVSYHATEGLVDDLRRALATLPEAERGRWVRASAWMWPTVGGMQTATNPWRVPEKATPLYTAESAALLCAEVLEARADRYRTHGLEGEAGNAGALAESFDLAARFLRERATENNS